MFSGSREVRERVEALETALKALHEHKATQELAWEELLDKVHRWMQRTSARNRTDDRRKGDMPDVSGPDPISAAIMAQRSRRVPPGFQGGEVNHFDGLAPASRASHARHDEGEEA